MAIFTTNAIFVRSNSLVMTEKQIKQLKDSAKEKIKKGITKEEALKNLVDAGILTPKGNFRKPYKLLGNAVTRKSK